MEIKDCIFSVYWSSEDNEWVAIVDKYPSLSWLDKDPSTAVAKLAQIVDYVRRDNA